MKPMAICVVSFPAGCGLFYKNICVGAGIPVACKIQFSILEL